MKHLLTISGSDCSGGSGAQADIKTFSAHGAYAMSIITAVMIQNSCGVFGVDNISTEIVSAQMDAVFTDIRVDGVKIGILSKPETVDAIADRLEKYAPRLVVLDPVMVSNQGIDLSYTAVQQSIINRLIPLAYVITPNIPEAEIITGLKINTVDDMKEAAVHIHGMGAENVFIKGGRLADTATDVLYSDNAFTVFRARRMEDKNVRGAGCAVSSAITANLAQGMRIDEAVGAAKQYITSSIANLLDVGSGANSVNHLYALYKRAKVRTE